MTKFAESINSAHHDISTRPIYAGYRTFLGRKDLVVSFYSKKCQYRCAYCNLSDKSSSEDVSADKIKQQIDWVFNKYSHKTDKIQQLSVGNEGTVIDTTRFPEEAMRYLLERSHELPALQVLSLETRPEYITRKKIEQIAGATHARILDCTVGFETQDDYLREVILKKSVSRKKFESAVKLMGEMGVRMTSYTLLKPGPTMTEHEGIAESVATIEYLSEICYKHGVELVIYLNPTYAAEGTPLSKAFIEHGYKPVRIQSVLEVILRTLRLNIPIYTGLWTEDNAEAGGDYTSHGDYKPEIKEMIREYNKAQDRTLLYPYMNNRERDEEKNVVQATFV